MVKTPVKKELRFTICKKCGATIDECGLCNYGCEFDELTESERPKEQIEIQVYKLTFLRTEPYKKKRARTKT